MRLTWTATAFNAVMLAWNLTWLALAPSWWHAFWVAVSVVGIALCGLAVMWDRSRRPRKRYRLEYYDRVETPHPSGYGTLVTEKARTVLETPEQRAADLYRDTLAQVAHAREWGLPTGALVALAEMYRVEAGIPVPRTEPTPDSG